MLLFICYLLFTHTGIVQVAVGFYFNHSNRDTLVSVFWAFVVKIINPDVPDWLVGGGLVKAQFAGDGMELWLKIDVTVTVTQYSTSGCR